MLAGIWRPFHGFEGAGARNMEPETKHMQVSSLSSLSPYRTKYQIDESLNKLMKQASSGLKWAQIKWLWRGGKGGYWTLWWKSWNSRNKACKWQKNESLETRVVLCFFLPPKITEEKLSLQYLLVGQRSWFTILRICLEGSPGSLHVVYTNHWLKIDKVMSPNEGLAMIMFDFWNYFMWKETTRFRGPQFGSTPLKSLDTKDANTCELHCPLTATLEMWRWRDELGCPEMVVVTVLQLLLFHSRRTQT